MKIKLFGHPLNPRARGTPLGARAPNSVQDSLNESSVRPNGTSVMPVLRSRAGQKSGLVKNPGWSLKKAGAPRAREFFWGTGGYLRCLSSLVEQWCPPTE